MADKWPSANGNWSTPGNWNGGTLPQPGDDVYADGKTIAIDQNVNVGSLRTTARSGGSAGGGFTLATAQSITMTGAGMVAGSSTVLTYSANAPTAATITGPIATSQTTTTIMTVVHSGTGTLNIVGDLSGWSAGARDSNGALLVSGGGVVNVTGAVLGVGTGGTNNWVIRTTTTATPVITIVGNVTASASVNQGGASLQLDIASTLTITGNVLGNGATATAISSTLVQAVTITGAVTASNGMAISLTGASVLTVTGTITAASGACAIESTSATATHVFSGPFVGHTSGQAPFLVRSMRLAPVANDYWRFKYGAGTADLVSVDNLTSVPAPADVRYGTSYALGAATGTMRVPIASQVRSGVAVDNTTGTLVLDPAAFWSYLRSAAVTAGSMGELLRQVATARHVGHFLAAYESAGVVPAPQRTSGVTARQFDLVGLTAYVGTAPPDSQTTATVWTIKRLTLNYEGAVTTTATASSVAWTDRLTATYT